MSRQIGAQSQAITSQYLVSQNASDGYFTSIQAAIDKAVADAVPAVILVKPGTYNENIVLANNVVIQATGMAQNDPLVTIQGSITASGSITSQISYCTIVAGPSQNAFYMTGSDATFITIYNCNIFSLSQGYAALKCDNLNQNSILSIQDSSVTHSTDAAINFVSDAAFTITGSTYISGASPITIQSDTPETAKITVRGFNSENYNNANGNTVTQPGVVFDQGYTPGTNGMDVAFLDMLLDVQNATFLSTLTISGGNGSMQNCSFYATGTANISYDQGTGQTNPYVTFLYCTFFNDQACIGGTSDGQINLCECSTANIPPGNYIAPEIIDSSFASNITVSANGTIAGIKKVLRIQREPNQQALRLPGFAVTGQIFYEQSGNLIGAYNSICDVNYTNESSNNFGYWASNCVFNNAEWTMEGDGSNNGGGYLRIFTTGEAELGVINSSSGDGTTRSYPDIALRLKNYQTELQPTFGQFTGSYKIETQAVYQTTNTTPYALFTLILNPLETVTITGTLVASTDDHSDACGGNFLATATLTSTGNITFVGAPIINLNSTTTANFYLSLDTQNQYLILYVVGLDQNYNWSSFLQYHKVLSNE